MKSVAVLVWAAILILAGLGICAYKDIELGMPVKADQ
jgi:hypothetical protein